MEGLGWGGGAGLPPWTPVSSVDSEDSKYLHVQPHSPFLRGNYSLLSWDPHEIAGSGISLSWFHLPWGFSELLSCFHFLSQSLLVEQELHRLVVFRTGDDPRLLGEEKILAGSEWSRLSSFPKVAWGQSNLDLEAVSSLSPQILAKKSTYLHFRIFPSSPCILTSSALHLHTPRLPTSASLISASLQVTGSMRPNARMRGKMN